MFRGSVLLCALLFNAPAIWQALALQTVGLETVAVHFLLTVPIIAVLLYLVRMAADHRAGYRRKPRVRGNTDN
jgi:hypothetical protein